MKLKIPKRIHSLHFGRAVISNKRDSDRISLEVTFFAVGLFALSLRKVLVQKCQSYNFVESHKTPFALSENKYEQLKVPKGWTGI